jgi:hypothetical protein
LIAEAKVVPSLSKLAPAVGASNEPSWQRSLGTTAQPVGYKLLTTKLTINIPNTKTT